MEARIKTKLLLGCSLSTSLLATGCTGVNKTADLEALKKPNVIFIVADDLGYGDISCYGAEAITTPHVDSLAASGLRFTDAHAVAATSTPSRYSLFTGLYSWRRNDTGIAAGNAGMVFVPNRLLLRICLNRQDILPVL
mgnify:CR=1 FL=1